jgi:hypothetical protein
MIPFPTSTDGRYDTCYASVPRRYESINGVKSFCGVEYRAAVNASGVVRLTPLSTATFIYNIPYPNTGWEKDYPMPCRNMNTSGLLQGAHLLVHYQASNPHCAHMLLASPSWASGGCHHDLTLLCNHAVHSRQLAFHASAGFRVYP